ncbi:uncharacterized protein LOC111049249 isoform X2 [Nilaparvata lugens]|uniref:uncharacterized protein LOC111049249 isoform X2 n=1 Tax=Nilaparvata lugens TaxID=108931 RepID=UPI00193E3A99|nr:uncharacterized protein LOC111049249 isoform X2 [Nilaparvata lugens]XP_039290876.1 uncharacterized protein LOC111049249 isoform X2 [Nilaparvata lugens]
MKLKKKHLEQQLTNLRDRIPLQNNSCKSEDISFLSLLYLIMVQTFGTILLFLYTLINFCTIILSLVKFFLGWLINVLKTPTKSSILIKSVVILLEFIALMVIVYKIASVVFVPIIGVQLTVANQLVWGGASSEEEEEEGRGLWFSGGDTREDTGEEGKAGEESMKMVDDEEQEEIALEEELGDEET